MGVVFVSYRRDDSEGQARALVLTLTRHLGKASVFMDVDSIALGDDFRRVLGDRLASCDVMLVLIGREWVDITDGSGRRRLDDPQDYVRQEIAGALRRNILVIPVLLQGAAMPPPERLPDDLRDLVYRSAFELAHDQWESDVNELLKRLGLVNSRRKYWLAGAAAGAVLLLGLGALAIRPLLDRGFTSGQDVTTAGAPDGLHHPVAPAPASKPSNGPTEVVVRLSGSNILGPEPSNLSAKDNWNKCSAGDGFSCGVLARFYAGGLAGLSKDITRAVALFQKGCDANNAEACTWLGYYYTTGEGGLPIDLTRAVTLFQKGCADGRGDACARLGSYYMAGEAGLAKDPKRSVAFFQKGCNVNDASACTWLGYFYTTGEGGLPKDLARAVSLFRIGCSGGRSDACVKLAELAPAQ